MATKDDGTEPTTKDKLTQALDPRLRPVQMTLEEAMAFISNRVYEATAIIEQLEGAGLISGNGHHARQKLAGLAAEEIKKRWLGQKTGN